MKKNLLLAVSLLLIIVSCKDDESVPKIEDEKKPSITIVEKEVNLSNEASSKIISFEANMNWTASSSDDWCIVSPTSGDASTKKITITSSENKSSEMRSCTITINVATISETVIVKQIAKDQEEEEIVGNSVFYVSENPTGIMNGDSEANAADYLNKEFWDQINRELRTKDIEVKFLPGIYSRVYDRGGLKLNGLGNENYKLTISGGENVIFQLQEKEDKQIGTLILLDGCKNVLIRDLHFTGNGKVGYVISFRSSKSSGISKNITIEDCSWLDLRGVIYGATGCHYEGTTNMTYKNCTFKRVGIDGHSHMMYNADLVNGMNIIDCHFEDCTGDYVRFRNACDYISVKNSIFIRNNGFPRYTFISIPVFNNEDPGDEYFVTNFSFTNNQFINNNDDATSSAIAFGHYGFSPKEFNYLLTIQEGILLRNGTSAERAKLLKENFNIDVNKIRIVNNTYTGKITDHVVLITKATYGAVSKGWDNTANITDLINDSEEPFEWEKE